MLDGLLAAPLSQIDPFVSCAATNARLSCPAPGRSLGGTVTRVERPIRAAVGLLGRAVAIDDEVTDSIFGCTVYGPEGFRESNEVRFVWFVVSVALTHALIMRSESVSSFRLALEWFFGEVRLARRLLACFHHQQIKAAEIELSKLTVSADLYDLLPYILEPHGHVTRSNLETCDVARKTRETKKDSGVYYTPSDIADFMVSSLADTSKTQGTWLDPACGTGVFLRAALVHHRKFTPSEDITEFALSNIFGIDKSALATDLSAFVLLIECASTNSLDHPHHHLFPLWQQLKGNIVCMDALRLVPRATTYLRCDSTHLLEISEIFPRVGHNGFDHVVMNPPYATTYIDKNLQSIWYSFSGVQAGQTADTHLAFSEMLWRLTSDMGVSAAVLPLSIGTNTTKSYARLRHELLTSSGTKEFLFFDREPQALFGEDIKTRNLILLRQGALGETAVRTSRLLKWTAEHRHLIFNRSRLVTIEASQCGSFIPKLGSHAEKITYAALMSSSMVMRAIPFAPQCGRVTLDEAVATNYVINRDTLLVASTAYNFVNCFFSDGLPVNPTHPYSSSPLNALMFKSKDEAYAAFALVSSRLCFWLWHVEGDGFHLTSNFLKRLPLWAVFDSEAAKILLSKHGKILWQLAKTTSVGAVNGGKQTYSFHCGYDHPSVAAIEQVLVKHMQLSGEGTCWLDDFVQATVSIDGKRRIRHSDPKLIKRFYEENIQRN